MTDLTPSERAALSEGKSGQNIHAAAAEVIRGLGFQKTLVDLGCGGGGLASHLHGLTGRYIGCDLVRYPSFPTESWTQFRSADLNTARFPFEDQTADLVVSVETIEHLENPRAFVRELARIAKPGGHVLVTTPNQLSLLSKLTFITRNRFNAFQDVHYPAHLTALLEVDLVRIAREAGLTDIETKFTNHGRIPGTARHWPRRLGLSGRLFSDNVLLIARKRG